MLTEPPSESYMRLDFEPNFDFQLQAIEAVCDLFRGQEVCRTEFTVTREAVERQARLAFAENDLGLGSRLTERFVCRAL